MKVQEGLIGIREVVLFPKKIFKLLIKRWYYSLIIGIIGGGIGYLNAALTPVLYTSQITFIVEESKSSGSMLNNIAGQFGIDVGSGSGGGVLNADNIIPFFRSQELCRSVLLMPLEGSNGLIVDKYASVYGLDKKWKKKFGNKYLGFSHAFKDNKLPRLEDSLLQIIIKKWVLKNDVYILRPDKKAVFFTLVTSMRDEKLSQLFCEKLLQQGVNKYLEIKTKSKLANVQILQRRADSLSAILRQKTYSSAAQQQVLLDLNPSNKTEGVNYEISAREKNMVTTIFAEVVKNLEVSKTLLSQETPTIQIIDRSYLPLETEIKKPYYFFVVYFFITIFLYLFFLGTRILMRNGLSAE
jgi:hypothetical protein